jgi:hypothetical protein
VTVCPLKPAVNVLFGELRIGQSTVKSVCEAYGTGGQDISDEDFAVQVYANPNYKPSAARPDDGTKADDGTMVKRAVTDETTDRHHARDFVARRQEPEVRLHTKDL